MACSLTSKEVFRIIEALVRMFEVPYLSAMSLQSNLGWERGCQLLAVIGAGTNQLKGFAVTGMNRNLAGFEFYSR